MSYCRWSCMNFACDLYCYEDVSGGFTTHVAGRRLKAGFQPPVNTQNLNEILAKWDEGYEHLTLPHAGETFNDPTLEAFKERLLTLRGIGYRFPDYALERIEAEIAEQAEQKEEA